MIKSGLVSVTFRALAPDAIISLVRQAGLDAVEWGGDVHVPHGDLGTAQFVGCATRAAGLKVAAYGSYYRAGESEMNSINFAIVLETATALGAPLIRIWAGNRSPQDADEAYRSRVAADTSRIAALAQTAGIRITYEYHPQTLTETPESAVSLLKAVDHPNLSTYWQVPLDATLEDRTHSLEAVLPFLSNVHVYNMVRVNGEIRRQALVRAESAWLKDLRSMNRTRRTHYALLEFVQDNDPANFLRDAAVLRGWLDTISAKQG